MVCDEVAELYCTQEEADTRMFLHVQHSDKLGHKEVQHITPVDVSTYTNSIHTTSEWVFFINIFECLALNRSPLDHLIQMLKF